MTTARSLDLVPDARAAGSARAFTRRALSDVADEAHLQDVLLVVSELVTNAVMHAGTRARLELRLLDDAVEVRLTDGDRRTPRRRTLVGGPAAQGRGLVLLQALAERWGADTEPGGKTVWAVLRLHDS